MFRRYRVLPVLVLLGVGLAIDPGCERKKQRWNLILLVGEPVREVRMSLDGYGDSQPGTISQQGDGAIIVFAGRKLLVERTRILLDGTEVGKLPEEAKKVEFDYSGNKLTGRADGVTVLEIILEKKMPANQPLHLTAAPYGRCTARRFSGGRGR